MPKNTKGLMPPWKKGQSGNPLGRPKKRPITDEYFALADVEVPEQVRKKLKLPKGLTFGQAGSLARWIDCLKPGGHMASKELREAMEGKAPQRIEIATARKTEITFRFISERKKKSAALNI